MCPATVGHLAPNFETLAITAVDAVPRRIQRTDYTGRWLLVVFYPRDFSFVCPTELIALSARIDDFRQRNCELLAVSVDSTDLHGEWLATPTEDGGLGPLQYPLASDPDGEMAQAFGVWVPEKQVSTRGLFIIDPDGLLQYSLIHNLSVGRNADEVLRVLDALRTGGLCPASWTRADGTLDAEGALQPGRILGHYRIREKLGEGSFGTVFAAWDLRLERMVALKILRKSLGESRESLLMEARTAAALNHPNVCAIHTVDIEDGLPLIAMEYVEGRTLDDLIQGGLDADSIRRLSDGIARGLATAHDQDVVHGDLKPANIIVSAEGEPKIVDFGLARSHARLAVSDLAAARDAAAASQAEEDPQRTVVYDSEMVATLEYSGGPVMGTPAYLAPEQAAGEPSTTASDVFSLALTIYEMLTGHRALQQTSLHDVLHRLRTEDLSQTLVSQVADGFRPMLSEMLRREPAARPSMRQVATQLDAWTEQP